jgi:hypothetical protein
MLKFDDFVPLAFILALAFTAVSLSKVISDSRIRRRLIDTGAGPDLAREVVGHPGKIPVCTAR